MRLSHHCLQSSDRCSGHEDVTAFINLSKAQPIDGVLKIYEQHKFSSSS